MNDRQGNTRQSGKSDKSFDVFWPETQQGHHIWLFILGGMAIASGLVAYSREPKWHDLEDSLPAIFVSMLSSSVAWYFILVVVRFVLKYFSREEGNDRAYEVSAEVPDPVLNQSISDNLSLRITDPGPAAPLQESQFARTDRYKEDEDQQQFTEVEPHTESEPIISEYIDSEYIDPLPRQDNSAPSGTVVALFVWALIATLVVIFLIAAHPIPPKVQVTSKGQSATSSGSSSPADDRNVPNRTFTVTIDDQMGDRHPSFLLDLSESSDYRNWFEQSRDREVQELKLVGLMGASAYFIDRAREPLEIPVFQFGTSDLAELALAAGTRNGIFVEQLRETRTWTDATGKFSREASFAGRSGNAVFLLRQLPEPALGVIAFDRLSKADREYVNSQLLIISAEPRTIGR